MASKTKQTFDSLMKYLDIFHTIVRRNMFFVKSTEIIMFVSIALALILSKEIKDDCFV